MAAARRKLKERIAAKDERIAELEARVERLEAAPKRRGWLR
ncbi:hypothetical protein [Nocardioides dongxiaopingii]|nr:hypothetical protein [Nocardioides sp. S-1144]